MNRGALLSLQDKWDMAIADFNRVLSSSRKPVRPGGKRPSSMAGIFIAEQGDTRML